MNRLLLVLVALVVVAAACSTDTGQAETSSAPGDTSATTTVAPDSETDQATPTPPAASDVSYAGTEPAPDFPEGLDWLNTTTPISLSQLEGKVVLLDFWTYGCINCIHIIPDLERLEAEYPDELVVIGVHSAKFLNEGETDNIRKIVQRYGVTHPVVNDKDFVIWQTWGANAWPTTVLIDPAGNIVGGHSGEGVYQVVEPVIRSLVAEFDALGVLDRTPVVVTPGTVDADTPLSFPGKVLGTADRIYIADSGHHRIVVTDRNGEVLDVYGDGRAGFRSGAGFEAQFNSPQGMALSSDGGILYVADTNNHAIRAIDLDRNVVSTLAGTGQVGWPPAAGLIPDVRLNSPWDVVIRDDVLYVAMAGHHQLWSIDTVSGFATPVVGNAREGTRNGPLADAELAQPSGLAFDPSGRLYFADSESSAVRFADVLAPDGMTGIVAGSNENLFDFGDIDGPAPSSRLQHPLGVAYDARDDVVFVADTYNSKIKRIDPGAATVTTYLGSERGWADGVNAQFDEPGGLSIVGPTMFVADTNNHTVRLVDLTSGSVSTLVLSGIERFAPSPSDVDYRGTIVRLDPVTVREGEGAFILEIQLPPNHKINEQASSSVAFAANSDVVAFPSGEESSLTGDTFPIEIGTVFTPGEDEVTADLVIVHCAETAESLCFIKQLRFVVPLVVSGVSDDSASATNRIPLAYEIALPDV